ncbi:hypothetical protein VPNG_00239 [Cytospora leucostoma]|uniref:DUF202 domain-containing protein n=1 Tax=Cytospora leucostoma TaxID=1230097 RepID=A0A423XN69_9PEZI|nr:hypothetical protein VPNG_00239 [Cytospora leucostoma]
MATSGSSAGESSIPSSSAPDLQTATTTASSASSSARPPTLQPRKTNSASSPRPIARVTTQERLDGILQLGFQRAETMSPGQSPPTLPRRGGASSSNQLGPNDSAPSAVSYQSIAETTGTRARRSGILKGDNKSGSNILKNTGAGAGRDQSIGLGGDAQNGSDGTSDGNGNGAVGSQEQRTWWRALRARFGSIELENKASVARDHLALERTFLAWLRTSLSFSSIGIAITQLFRLNTSLTEDDGEPETGSQHTLRHLGKPLGAIFLGISILILFLGYHRYFQAQSWIIRGKFPASRGTIILVSLVALVLMVISLVVVIVVQPATSGG